MKLTALQSAGTTLDADVSASAEYKRTFNWTIDKSVAPDAWNLFVGDSGTSRYSITVTKGTGVDEAKITGQICVTNGGAVPTQDLAINTDLEVNATGGYEPVLSGMPVDVSGKPVLNPGDTYCYDYSITIPQGSIVPGATYKVTANVTITNHSGPHYGEPYGPSPKETADLPQQPVLVHDSISVTDTNGEDFTNITNTSTFNYYRTFTCEDDGTNGNTATIIYEGNVSGPSASASVLVHCYSLNVLKTVNTSYTRTYEWTIDKTVSEDNVSFADTATLVIPIGGTHAAYYRARVLPTGTDGDFKASGTISITNNAPMAATINSITDEISGVGTVPVDCHMGSVPFILAGNGGIISCDYATSPDQIPDKASRMNTASVTIQNYDYPYDGSDPSPSGTTSFSDSKAVVFSNTPSVEVDKYVDVTDDLYGHLGMASATDPLSQTFNYTRAIGPYPTCGNRTVVNTASFTSVPWESSEATGATGSDSATVFVNVPCNGCTYTIGFWKTHAGFTGNNPDLVTPLLPIWLGTEYALKSVQVTSAAQAVELLSFSGNASNGINKLYAQLLGAKLNIKNGADGSAVSTIINSADAFLATKNSADWNSLTKAQKTQVTNWAATLDNYNNGLIGPGHCSESGTFPPSEDEDLQIENGRIVINVNISNSSNFRVMINNSKKCDS